MDAPSIAAIVSVCVIILVAAAICIVIYFGDLLRFESRSHGWLFAHSCDCQSDAPHDAPHDAPRD
jgi:hypothetical protein